MKMMKRALSGILVAAMLAAGSLTAVAASYETPADVVAGLTGRTVEEVIQERIDTGKTYGSIAKDAGKLDQFQQSCLELKKEYLDEDVANGWLSQEEADEILAAIEARQAVCDGTGAGYYNQGVGFGRGRGCGGGGRGAGCGFRGGSGYRNGICPYYN